MPSRPWEPCQILEQGQAWLTLCSPRQRLRRHMSMRTGDGDCFPIGKYQVFCPQFDCYCVSRIHRSGFMYLFWRSSHTCYGQSAPDRSQRSPVIRAKCSKRRFSRQGLVYFPELYSSSLCALCWAYMPRSHSAPVHAQTDQCTTQPAVLVGEPLEPLSLIQHGYVHGVIHLRLIGHIGCLVCTVSLTYCYCTI